MNLKEYIKSLVRKQLEEESASGDAGGYLTPRAFSSKGQKKNTATKYAEKEGWKVTKGMPKHSKMLDYKELWKGKKSAMNELLNELAEASIPVSEIKKIIKLYAETDGMTGAQLFNALKDLLSKYKSISERSNYDAPSGYTAASGYTGPSLATKGGGYYASTKENQMKESLNNIIEKELINEVTYNKFKTEVKFRTKSEQLHKAIREVKRKLQEIDRIVEYTSRMKQELSEDGGINYWKATQKNVGQISEMINQLNNKIKNLNQ